MKLVSLLLEKTALMVAEGELKLARAVLEDLVPLASTDPDVHAALGKVCGYLNDHPAAIVHLERAEAGAELQLDNTFTLSYEYCQVGRFGEAIDLLDKLVKLVPQLPALHRWRGHALAEAGRGAEAWGVFQEALRLKPDYAEVLCSMANLLYKHRHIDRAEQYLLRAIACDPERSAAHNDLGRIYRVQGRMDEAVACFYKALQLEPHNLAAVSNCLYAQCYCETVSPEELAAEHRRLADRFCSPQLSEKISAKKHPTNHKKLRIGYMSGDFATHSVSYFFEPILRAHDQRNFEIICYSNRALADETTQRIKELSVAWRDTLGVPAKVVAEWIVADEIDLLVDLAGHSAGHRLDVMALRPAQVQCSWIGYPHSTGLAEIDYYITDAWCDPPGMTEHLYSEQLWRLPRVFSCYLPPSNFPAVSEAPFHAEERITFGCFNNLAKVGKMTIAVWAAVLRGNPGALLCLKSGSLGGERTRRRVLEQFAVHGVAPERVVLQPFASDTFSHLAQYAKIDIALDTFPYHGTTTTCEAFFMGVPVVTLAGSHHLSRVGVSFLHAVGLDDLIAKDADEFVAIASGLARDPQRLQHLREQLRTMLACSPLMDASGVTREIEDAYSRMLEAGGRDGKSKNLL